MHKSVYIPDKFPAKIDTSTPAHNKVLSHYVNNKDLC